MLDQLPHEGASRTSLDLGKTETTVFMQEDRVRLSDEATVSLDELRMIAECDDAVFALREGAFEKLFYYSEATRRTYKLRPTPDWPALEISGILMHRIKGTTPKRDAEAKLRLASPVRGAVLDTCMGLGYSAILAAESAASVTVIELKAEISTVVAALIPTTESMPPISRSPVLVAPCRVSRP